MTYYKIKTTGNLFKEFAKDNLSSFTRQYGFIYFTDTTVDTVYFATDNQNVLDIVLRFYELESTTHPDLFSIENWLAVNFDLYFSNTQDL